MDLIVRSQIGGELGCKTAIIGITTPGKRGQSGPRPGQTSLPINGLTTSVFPLPLPLTTLPRAFPRPILLTTPHVLDCSDDIVLLSHPPHLVYQLPVPPPDNSIMIAITVSVWIVLFM